MDISKILLQNFAGAQWVLYGDNYSGLTWLSDTPKPTLEELEAHWEVVEFEIEVERVQALRKAAYQNESDPIFFDWQRGEVMEQEWLDSVQAIKDRYPYPVVEEGES